MWRRVAGLCLIAGCGRAGSPDGNAGAEATPPPAVADVSPCGRRPVCRVEKRFATSTNGVEVLELSLAPAGANVPCPPREHWLVGPPARVPGGSRLLLATCGADDSPNAPRDDTFAVKDGVFTYAQEGGGRWRFSSERTLQLVPLRLIASRSSVAEMERGMRTDSHTDFRDLSGRTHGTLPRCDERAGEPLHFDFAPIPRVQGLPPGLGDSTPPGLGSCALQVDASGRGGYLLHGAPGEADDARLRVLALDARTLLLEVEDDRVIGPSARWLFDDHVEVWTAPDDALGKPCHGGKAAAQQWAIRLADGQVFSAYGKPAPLEVRVVRVDDERVRLRIALPAATARVSVVYSDGDDGLSQERLLSTSQLVYGDGATLSQVVEVPSRAARCSTVHGMLRLEPGELGRADEPYLPSTP
jgi:hypothetical protein